MSSFVTRFAVAQSFQKQSADAENFFFSKQKLQTSELAAILHFDDVSATFKFDYSSHVPNEKGFSDKKFKSNHQTFSAGGRGRLGTRLVIAQSI